MAKKLHNNFKMFSTMTGRQWWGIVVAESQERKIHPLKEEDDLEMKTEGGFVVLGKQGCQRGKNMSATFLLLLSIPCSLQVTKNNTSKMDIEL